MKSETMIVFLCFLYTNSMFLNQNKERKLTSLNHDHYQCSCSSDCLESSNCCPYQALCSNEKNFVLNGNFTFDSYENNVDPEIENIMENTENSFNEHQEINESINSENQLANTDLLDMSREIRGKNSDAVNGVKKRLSKSRKKISFNRQSDSSILPQTNDNHSYEATLPAIELKKEPSKEIAKDIEPVDIILAPKISETVKGTLSNAEVDTITSEPVVSPQLPNPNITINKLNESIDSHSKLLDKTNSILENINKTFIDSKLAEKSEPSQVSSEGKAKTKDCLSVTTNQLRVTVKGS